MTSAVATVGVEYDDVDVQEEDLQIFLEIVKGLNESPTVRGTDSIVPAAEGRVEGLRINDVLKIELYGFVRADPELTDEQEMRESYRANVQTVRALFATDRARAFLDLTLENGQTQSISARPLNVVWVEHVKSHFANVSIELEGYGDWVIGGS